MSTLTQGKLENKTSYLRRRVGGWVLYFICLSRHYKTLKAFWCLSLLSGKCSFYSGMLLSCAGILEQSMGARNRVGIGLSYRHASLQYIAWRNQTAFCVHSQGQNLRCRFLKRFLKGLSLLISNLIGSSKTFLKPSARIQKVLIWFFNTLYNLSRDTIPWK